MTSRGKIKCQGCKKVINTGDVLIYTGTGFVHGNAKGLLCDQVKNHFAPPKQEVDTNGNKN